MTTSRDGIFPSHASAHSQQHTPEPNHSLLRAPSPRLRIVHFGLDDLHRAAALRQAGYSVLECATLPELISAVRMSGPVDLICISEAIKPEEGPLAIARAYSSAPIVLFRSSQKNYVQRSWSLEVPPQTEPHVWLPLIHSVLSSSGRPAGVPHR